MEFELNRNWDIGRVVAKRGTYLFVSSLERVGTPGQETEIEIEREREWYSI